jgi:hypothetical protein
MPNIAVINESTVVADPAVQAMLPAFEQQWNRDLQPIWRVDSAAFAFSPKAQPPKAGSWWVVFLDDSDQANALAYHDLTNEGLPISKVFVKSVQADHASLSVAASHEICEMAVDPWLNGAYQDANGVFWAAEICDPVESDQYGYDIGGVLVSDFVTPNWFAHPHAQKQMDFSGHAGAAFKVLSGGYAQKYLPGQGWVQVTGAAAAATLRGSRPSPGTRRERRRRHWRDWTRSDRVWG